MLTFTSAAARRDLADVIRLVRRTRQRAVITRYGIPLVAIVPIEDLERLLQASGSPAPVLTRSRRKPVRR
jgi:prevent-host-death family protein